MQSVTSHNSANISSLPASPENSDIKQKDIRPTAASDGSQIETPPSDRHSPSIVSVSITMASKIMIHNGQVVCRRAADVGAADI